jgi:hypothetical protein
VLGRGLQGAGDLRLRRDPGQLGQGAGMGHHTRNNPLPFGRIEVRSYLRCSLVTGQQSIQRSGVGLTDRREVRLQVSQATVSHRQLGRGPTGRCPLEQRRSTLDGHAQGVREIAGLAGGHGRRGQRPEDQHNADGGHRQSSGSLPGPASDQPTWPPARLRRGRASGRQSPAQCGFGPHLSVKRQVHFCQPAQLHSGRHHRSQLGGMVRVAGQTTGNVLAGAQPLHAVIQD